MSTAAADPPKTFNDAVPAAVHLSSGVWAGLLSGFVIGGIGGRLAMFVLRLTSDPSLVGRLTDDDFEIGAFTDSTIFLVALCTAAGVVGGCFYLLIRSWLPKEQRVLLFGALLGLIGGAMIVEPGGIDFTDVEPHALAIALFILLPALFGMSVSFLAERFLTRKASGLSKVVAFLPLLGLGILGPFGLIALALAFAGWMLNSHFPLTTWWGSPWVTRVGRTALLAIAGLSAVNLVKDVVEIV
jgi:hypothetical protein